MGKLLRDTVLTVRIKASERHGYRTHVIFEASLSLVVARRCTFVQAPTSFCVCKFDPYGAPMNRFSTEFLSSKEAVDISSLFVSACWITVHLCTGTDRFLLLQ